MKLIHKQELKQRLKPVQFQNISKEDSFMYKMGVKAGYRLALQQLNNNKESLPTRTKVEHIKSNYNTAEMNRLIEFVINSACLQFNVNKDNLLSDNRFRKYVRPRSVIINVLRHVSKFSTLQIATAINRDHTTVLHHLKSKDNKDYCWKDNPAGKTCWKVYEIVSHQLTQNKQIA